MGGLLGLYLEELVFEWAQDVKETERNQKEEQDASRKKIHKKKDKCVVTVIEENGKKKRKPLFIFRTYPKQIQPSNENEKKKKKR